MKTAKPIFIVNMPEYVTDEEYDLLGIGLEKFNDDYYVVLLRGFTDSIEFQCFYEKDFNEVKYNELKKIVENSIKK